MLFLRTSVFSANTFTYPDTTISRGDIIDLQTNIISEINYKEINLMLHYNNRVIDVKSIKPAQLNAEFEFNYVLSHKLDTGFIEINIKNLKSEELNKKIELILKVEALTAPLRETQLKILHFKVNGQGTEFTQSPSKITIPGELINQGTPYNISPNYPNPFLEYTSFPFSINDDGLAEFKIYNSLGQEVFNNSNLSDNIKILKLEVGGGAEIIANGVFYLKKGKYRLDFNPVEPYFSAGVYFLTMKVNNVFLSKPFVYCP